MIKKSKITVFSLLMTLLMLGACDTADDNNPSPVPDARDKFVGTWNVNNEDCGKGKYVVNITKDASNSVQLLIENFAFSHAGEPDTAILAGSSIAVYPQVNSEGWRIEGIGNYNADETIKWNYSLLISGTQETCTCTYVKTK